METYVNSISQVKARLEETVSTYCSQNRICKKDLAAQMGMTPSTLSRLLNDQRNILVDDIFLVAQTCGVSAVYLLTGLDVDKTKAEKFNRMLGWFTPEEQETVFNTLYAVAEGMRKIK